MSGGSYDYLYRRELLEDGVLSDLERARDRLTGLGYADDAAAKVQSILDAFSEAIARRDEVAEVLQVLEWWDSHDNDEDQFQEALKEFRAQQTAEEEQ